MTSSTPSDVGGEDRAWLQAGTVGRPHGLDGSFHVSRPRPQMLALGMSVVVDGVERRIARRAGTDERPILRLEGCENRVGAQALGGHELLVPRSRAPALEADEWWAEDLEGCAVADGARRVGTVRRLVALPSCEVLEVARDDDRGDLLVPLVSDAVRGVDLSAREIQIDLRFLGED